MAADLGLRRRRWGDEDRRPADLRRPLEPLVALMQETPVDRLCRPWSRSSRPGPTSADLVAAAALANARTFGGEDYVGFHTMMALAPAYHMARRAARGRGRPCRCSRSSTATPTASRSTAAASKEVLHPVEPRQLPARRATGGEALRDAVRAKDMNGAESTFAVLAQAAARRRLQRPALRRPGQHRGPSRRPALPRLGPARPDRPGAGPHAAAAVGPLLRQERARLAAHRARPTGPRVVLPKLLDQYKLLGRPLGTREADDAWVDRMSQTIFEGTPDQAAEAAAAALAEGMSPDARSARRSRWPPTSSSSATPAGRSSDVQAEQAAGQRPRRLDRRPRLRLGQRLAEHGPGRATRGTRSPA